MSLGLPEVDDPDRGWMLSPSQELQHDMPTDKACRIVLGVLDLSQGLP